MGPRNLRIDLLAVLRSFLMGLGTLWMFIESYEGLENTDSPSMLELPHDCGECVSMISSSLFRSSSVFVIASFRVR